MRQANVLQRPEYVQITIAVCRQIFCVTPSETLFVTANILRHRQVKPLTVSSNIDVSRRDTLR